MLQSSADVHTLFHERKQPMTMQIGMVGTNGLVLASDTLHRRDGQVRTTYSTSKIEINHERGIAVSKARDMALSAKIATDILKLTDDQKRSPLGTIQEIAASHLEGSERFEAECLIVLTNPLRLFHLETRPIECVEVTDMAYAGDRLNSAVYWAERFYTQSMSQESLIPVGAHLVYSASKIEPSSVAGLEILVCNDSGFRFLPKEEIERLKSRSEQLETMILNFIEVK